MANDRGIDTGHLGEKGARQQMVLGYVAIHKGKHKISIYLYDNVWKISTRGIKRLSVKKQNFISLRDIREHLYDVKRSTNYKE